MFSWVNKILNNQVASQNMTKKLIVCETNTSTWHYHLRSVTPGEEKYSGGMGLIPLCEGPQVKIGWDCKVPLSAYNPEKSSMTGKYCKDCAKVAKEQGLL